MISVIIPALNEEAIIGKCLRSLKHQRYSKEYEIIVADNGSTDRTVDIAKTYADKVIVEEERGKAAAGNAGAKVAEGDMLVFVDADTVVPRNWMRTIDASMDNPVVIGGTCRVAPLKYDPKSHVVFSIYDLFVRHSIKVKEPKTWGAVIIVRKEVFDAVGGFQKLTRFEDQDLVARIKDMGEFIMIDETLALTSPRRVRDMGILETIKFYFIDYLTEVIRDRC